MTDDKNAVRALLEKGFDTTLLREMIGFAAELLMALETDSLCGVAPGRRSPDRQNQRNGYRDGQTRRHGGAAHTQNVHGSYFTGFLEPRRMAEEALLAVVQEAYLQGVSTRILDDLVKALGIEGISKS